MMSRWSLQRPRAALGRFLGRVVDRRASWRPAVFVLAIGIVWSMPARSQRDYQSFFSSGVQAYDKKRYKEAADAMRQALEARPQESADTVKITSVWRQAYIPHFFRGAALYGLGDCPGALREWKESERQGFTGYGRDEMEVVSAHRAACLGPVLEERSRSADAELEQAERERQSLLQLEATQGVREALSDPVLRQREQSALALLNTAREQASAAKAVKDVDALSKAQDLAKQAGVELRAVMEQAAERASQVSPAGKVVAPMRPAAVPGPPAKAAPKIREISAPSSPVPATPAAPLPVTTPAAHGADHLPENDAARAVPVVPRQAVPMALRQAAHAFFAGRYAETVQILASNRLAEPSFQAEAAMFAAASHMAQFWLGGMRDQGLLEAARDDVARCKRLDRELTPDRRIFSPRFVGFFTHPDLAAGPAGPLR